MTFKQLFTSSHSTVQNRANQEITYTLSREGNKSHTKEFLGTTLYKINRSPGDIVLQLPLEHVVHNEGVGASDDSQCQEISSRVSPFGKERDVLKGELGVRNGHINGWKCQGELTWPANLGVRCTPPIFTKSTSRCPKRRS